MPEVYVVVWDDAHGNSSMFDANDVEHKPYRFTSIGLKVRSDEVGVSLAGELGDDGRYRDHTFIPRLMVIEEYSLGNLKRPRKKNGKTKPSRDGKSSLLEDSQVVGS